MAKKRILSDKQQHVIDILFTPEVKGDVAVAAKIAGYSPGSVEWLTNSLKEEIVEASQLYLASHTGMAVVTTVDGMRGQANATMLTAARDILDRGGLAKQGERPAEIVANKLFILPPKASVQIVDDDNELVQRSD